MLLNSVRKFSTPFFLQHQIFSTFLSYPDWLTGREYEYGEGGSVKSAVYESQCDLDF